MLKSGAGQGAQLLTSLSQQMAQINMLVKQLQLPDLKQVELARKELLKRLPALGELTNQVIKTFQPATANLHSDLIKFADDLDRVGLHKFADLVDSIVETEPSELLHEAEVIYSGLVNAPLATWGNDVKQKTDELLGLINKYKQASVKNNLIKLADYFDRDGFHCLADLMDSTNTIFDKFGFMPRIKKEEKPEAQILPPADGTLSTRYCPDHNGLQAIRIAEYIYQCPVDGKIYNYTNGYINYKGQQVMGGSISNQTPKTTNYGGVPLQYFDPRANVINTIY